MTTLGEIKVPMLSVMKNVTLNVEVTGMRAWKFRMYIGEKLLRLAAYVMGCGIRITSPPKKVE